MYSPHQESMARYEKELAQAKVTEGGSAFNEVVADLVEGGEESIKAYAEETERLWDEADPWERIGLGRRYDVVELALTKIASRLDGTEDGKSIRS